MLVTQREKPAPAARTGYMAAGVTVPMHSHDDAEDFYGRNAAAMAGKRPSQD